MGQITLTHTLQNGAGNVNDADQVMQNFNDIVTVVNGQLDGTNLATGAISDPSQFEAGVVDATAIGTSAVTTSKVLDGAITLPKIDNTTIPSIGRVLWVTGADTALVNVTGQVAAIAFTTVDATSSTSAATRALIVRVHLTVTAVTAGVARFLDVKLRRNGDTDTTRKIALRVGSNLAALDDGALNIFTMTDIVGVDSGQVFEYATTISGGGAWTYDLQIYLLGYVEDYE